MTSIDDPFDSQPLAEIPLHNAPLVRVIAQLRFPLVIAIEQQEFVAPFQEAIRSKYPVLRRDQTPAFSISPSGVSQMPPQVAWRFMDINEDWRVTLTPEFVALETKSYKSRNDFLERLRQVVSALNDFIEPKLVDRFGLRYIDRVAGPRVNEIAQMVRPEICGIAGTPISKHVSHMISENLFLLNETRFLARWGHIPANVTVDPGAIEPIAEPSWILDFDMFTAVSQPFNVALIEKNARDFAERIYKFFRWAVTEDFLKMYGGQL